MMQQTNLPVWQNAFGQWLYSVEQKGEYNKNAVEPGALDCDYLIADEFSMVDIGLCKELFLALNFHARIIIIGDYNQLPSVGPGLVLRGLIHADIFPTQNLTQVFRHAGHVLSKMQIVSCCRRTPIAGCKSPARTIPAKISTF